MKKYLFFPTYEAEWSLDPQYVLCGDPRTAILTPISNASTFLWEQIEPDPLTQPITILPNNNSKDVTIIIPNTISTNIKLKVTLNGDINDYRYVIVIPLIVDDIFSLSRGSGLVYNNNTLNDPINLMLAPYPPAGPQAIQYTSSSQSTGVRLLTQYYRQGYISSIDVLTNTNSFITNVNVFRNALYDFSAENRININVNKDYKFLKNWTNVKVFSEEIISIPQSIKIEYPTFIADDYANSFSRGSGLGSSVITPYTSNIIG